MPQIIQLVLQIFSEGVAAVIFYDFNQFFFGLVRIRKGILKTIRFHIQKVVFLIAAGLQNRVEKIIFFLENLELLVQDVMLVIVQKPHRAPHEQKERKGDGDFFPDTDLHR